MYVSDWMSKRVISVEESDSLSVAINTMKRNKIRHLPVLNNNKLVGIVTDRDIKRASPSKVTSLDIWEVHYLMSKINVKDVMVKNPYTISPEATIEKAALIMDHNKIGSLPVLNADNNLVGLLSIHDIFLAFISITGANTAVDRIAVEVPDEPGSIQVLCDYMRKYPFKCVSILSTYENVAEGSRLVLLRFTATNENKEKIVAELKANYDNVKFTTD